MAENSNVKFICADCAPRPDPALHKHRPSWFVGRHVKRAFRGSRGDVEHMWVHVIEHWGPYLVGTLDNEPILNVGVQRGDRVIFAMTESEAASDFSNKEHPR